MVQESQSCKQSSPSTRGSVGVKSWFLGAVANAPGFLDSLVDAPGVMRLKKLLTRDVDMVI